MRDKTNNGEKETDFYLREILPFIYKTKLKHLGNLI